MAQKSRFTGTDGFQKRQADSEKIALALDFYFRGLSFRKVVDHFRQVHRLRLSPMTVIWTSSPCRRTHDDRLAFFLRSSPCANS